MLNEILYEGSLTPQSNLWRDSLFQLGSLHFRHAEVIGNDQRKLEEAKSNVSNQLTLLEDSFKEYQKCIEVLEEAVQRYDSDERSFQAQYLLAEAYRKSANWPKKLLEQNLLSTEEKRSQRSQQKVELLQRALTFSLPFAKNQQPPRRNRTGTQTSVHPSQLLFRRSGHSL